MTGGFIEGAKILRERIEAQQRLARRVVTFDDTGEEREITGYCQVCKVDPEDWPPQLVSPTGVVHHADMDTTDCGHDATRDRWWWHL